MWPSAPKRCGSSACAVSQTQAWLTHFRPAIRSSGPPIARSISPTPSSLCRTVAGTGAVGMTAADWRSIRAPTVVASGAHDFLWPPKIGRQVADLIPGAKFAIMQDAGHFLHLQAPETLVGLAR